MGGALESKTMDGDVEEDHGGVDEGQAMPRLLQLALSSLERSD
jgi:hypothetical protein